MLTPRPTTTSIWLCSPYWYSLHYAVRGILQLSDPHRLQLHHHPVLLLPLAEPQGCTSAKDCTVCWIEISGAVIILFVVDFLFAVTEIPVWTSTDNLNSVWQTIRPLHNFGIFCYVLINLLKIVLIFFTCRAGKAASQSQVQ